MAFDLPLDEDDLRRKAWHLPTELPDLLRVLGASKDNLDPLLEFLTAPAAEPMPDDTLRQIVKYLEGLGAADRLPAQVKFRLK